EEEPDGEGVVALVRGLPLGGLVEPEHGVAGELDGEAGGQLAGAVGRGQRRPGQRRVPVGRHQHLVGAERGTGREVVADGLELVHVEHVARRDDRAVAVPGTATLVTAVAVAVTGAGPSAAGAATFAVSVPSAVTAPSAAAVPSAVGFSTRTAVTVTVACPVGTGL